MTAQGASLTSDQGAIHINAANNIHLSTAQSTHQVDESHQHHESGFLSSTTITTRDTLNQTQQQGSSLSGQSVNLQAGGDVTITGSQAVSTEGTVINAQRNVTLAAASNTFDETHARQVKTSGLMSSGGIGFTIGSRKQSADDQSHSESASASTVGSTQGDVNISAAQTYQQTGSDVLAPEGSIHIAAQQINITEARNTQTQQNQQRFEQTGITVAVSNPVIAAVQTAQQMVSAASHTTDARMQVLAGANVALASARAYDAVQTGQGTTINGKENQIATGKDDQGNVTSRDATAADKVGGITVAISVGTSRNQSQSTQTTDSAAPSHLMAGKDITLQASGAQAINTQANDSAPASDQHSTGSYNTAQHNTAQHNTGTYTPTPPSDITIQGTTLSAGGDIQLQAEHDIQLLAARNTTTQHSTNSNSSVSLGVAISSGPAGSGVGFTAAASGGRGHADGTDLTHTNTQLIAGHQASLTSGSDTTLQGATVSAPQISAQVGGHLTIESLQDSSTYESQQEQIGGSVMVGSNVSGNLSLNHSHTQSEYTSVNQSSAFMAGDRGFNVQVQGNTTLNGGLITSTQAAIDQQANTFHTAGTLTTTDLQNRASYHADAEGLSLGAGLSTDGKLAPAGTGAGIGSDGGELISVTRSGISGIAGQQDVRTGDKASGIGKIFDANRVQQDVNAQVQITQTFSQYAPQAVANYADKQKAELTSQANKETDPAKRAALLAEAQQWSDGGNYRVALHTATGGLAGGLSGAVGAGTVAAAAPLMNELQSGIEDKLTAAGVNPTVAKGASQVIALTTAATTGALVSGGSLQGAAAGLNVDANNRQLHPEEKTLAQVLAKKSGGKYTAEQIEAQMRGMTMTTKGVTEAGTPDTVIGGVPKLDNGGTWLYAGTTSDGKPIIVQQLDPAEAELRAFIVSNTNGNAVPSLINYAGPTTAPPSPTIVNTLPPSPEGTTRVPIVVEGVVYFPLVANCPAASCTTGDVIAQAIPDAGTNAYTEAVARKVEKDLNVATAVVGVGGAVVRGMGVLGEVAGVIKTEANGASRIQTILEGSLPNGDRAIIEPEKMTGYALNPAHPIGGNKAVVFDSALGYNLSNSEALIAQVQKSVTKYPATLGKADQFGQRYTVDMPIAGPNGNIVPVRTGWIFDPGSTIPRLITIYVK